MKKVLLFAVAAVVAYALVYGLLFVLSGLPGWGEPLTGLYSGVVV